MADEANPKEGAAEPTVDAAAGLIESMIGDNMEIGEPEPPKPKQKASEPPDEEDPDEETDTDPEEEEEDQSGEEDPDETPEEDSEEEPETELYTVKVKGKEIQVSQEELISGYQRTADYTQKTQELSEQRKEMDSELHVIRADRQKYAEALQEMDQNADAELKRYQETDWDTLKDEDPDEYRDKRDDYRELQEAKRKITEEKTELLDKARADNKKRFMEIAKGQAQELMNKIPAWKDKKKLKIGMKRLTDYGLSIGYKETEINSILDHRHLLVLEKARKYDAVRKSDPSKNRVRNVPKYTRPGAQKTPQKGSKAKIDKAGMQKLKQSGTVKDAASLIANMEI